LERGECFFAIDGGWGVRLLHCLLSTMLRRKSTKMTQKITSMEHHP